MQGIIAGKTCPVFYDLPELMVQVCNDVCRVYPALQICGSLLPLCFVRWDIAVLTDFKFDPRIPL